MKLWIKSQDKETLRLAEMLDIYDGSVDEEKCFVIEESGVDLGFYKTKERALEVLNEIQKKINLINLGHDFGSTMIDLKNPTYIYEMPKE